MILLTAIRKDAYGHFEFRIEGKGVGGAVVIGEALKAAKILASLSVESPLRLVEHARDWGSVEIHEPES